MGTVCGLGKTRRRMPDAGDSRLAPAAYPCVPVCGCDKPRLVELRRQAVDKVQERLHRRPFRRVPFLDTMGAFA